MAEELNVHLIDHPLIQHKLTLMREKETGTKDFRELLEEIAMLMTYEITRDFPLKDKAIETPVAKCTGKVLAGKKVGVQKDSSALAALEGDSKDLADTFGNLTQYADYNTAFMDLTAGAIDAVAIDIGVANYEIGQRGSGYKILDDYLSTEQYAVGFKLGNTELRDIVQKDMDALAKDGTVDKIAAVYADFGIPESLCIGKDQ